MRMTASWSGRYGPTEYKVVARSSAPDGKPPSDRRPDRIKPAVVLEAVKVWPSNGGACRKVGATANLDSLLRAPAQAKSRSGRRNGSQIEQRN